MEKIDYLDDIGLDEPPFNPLNITIIDCEFSTRLYHILKVQLQCETLGDVVEHSKLDIMRTPNCGKKSYEELIETLTKHGLKLNKESKWSSQYEHTAYLHAR